jgi:hypothetical protein
MAIERHTLAWMQRVAAAAILLYWIVFWFDQAQLPMVVQDYELNFILPDILWIVALLLVASRGLIAGEPRAFALSAAAGGALVFLGLLDVVFNARHGQYTASAVQGFVNAAVNVGCILFGLWNIYAASPTRPTSQR